MVKIKKLKTFIVESLATITLLIPIASTALAANETTIGFSVSPMGQSIVLMPGDTYYGSFSVVNPNNNTSEIFYEVSQKSFYVDEDYGTTFDEEDSPIVEWTTIESGGTGIIAPNSKSDVIFKIEVPTDAPAGGQYEAFNVAVKGVAKNTSGSESNSGLTVQENMVISHLVFAEIAGDTVRQGEITDISVPSFLFSGDITGHSAIRNTGNIHGVAKYTLQVFPLFSDEEMYTNEEHPMTNTILPDRTFYFENSWKDTPAMGIFRVVYTVEFEGAKAQVSKVVIKCPIWLLFIIIFVVFAIIIWFISRAKMRKKK